jgi:hypothetical protein
MRCDAINGKEDTPDVESATTASGGAKATTARRDAAQSANWFLRAATDRRRPTLIA